MAHGFDTKALKGVDSELSGVPRLMKVASAVHGGISEAARGKRLLVFTMGSRGDVQPFAALCSGLQDAGFVVRVLTNVNHVPFLQEFGLDAVASSMDAEKWIMDDPMMRTMMAEGGMLKLSMCLAKINKRDFPKYFEVQLREARLFEPDALLSTGLEGTQAYAIGHVMNIPVIPCHLTAILPSAQGSSLLGEPCWLPRWCHLLAWRLMASLFAAGEADGKHATMLEQLPECEPSLARNVEQFSLRSEVQCEPQLFGVSSALITPRSDWPYQPVFTGYWIVSRDEQERRMVRGDVSFGGGDFGTLGQFLAQGKAPAYIGWGSMLAVSSEHMACLAVRALKEAGLRGIVMGGWAELCVDNLRGHRDSKDLLAYAAENVLFVRAAPHEWLFPKCSAIVHHGGSGTTAAALRSGRPSIVTPCGFDQFINARIVAESGAGVGLQQISKITTRDLATALTRVTGDDTLIERALALGERLRSEDGVGVAVRVLDKFFAEEVVTGAWEAKAARKQQAFQDLASRTVLSRLGLCCSYICGGAAVRRSP